MRGRPSRPRRLLSLAQRASRHELYETAVQDPAAEVAFIRDTYQAIRGRRPRILREDFSGPAGTACRWVQQGADYRALGVDIDPAVLDWGRRHRVARLSETQQRRITLIRADVLKARTEPVDVVAAFNFSYWIFKKRPLLRRYFRSVGKALRPDGLFFLDAFGGYDAFRVLKERRVNGHFTYVWEQADYHPVTGDIRCHIHFRFPDGSRLRRAFTYDWRLWTLPEICEVLREAGFRRSTVYWEGDDGEGGGNGEFRAESRGEADRGWIAYVVAEK